MGFRVPLRPLSKEVRKAFVVELECEDRKARAYAVDLSLTGILVECDGLAIKETDQITVSLALDGDEVTLTANVVRQQGKLVALHFPECVQGGELEPPEALLGIYRSLELEWLKSRVHV